MGAEKDIDPDKVILQLHGGAYIRSLRITALHTAVRQCNMRLSGAGVLTVDYRVAPNTLIRQR